MQVLRGTTWHFTQHCGVRTVLRAACLPSLFLACGQRCVVAHQAAVALVRSLVWHGGAAEVLKSALGSTMNGRDVQQYI